MTEHTRPPDDAPDKGMKTVPDRSAFLYSHDANEPAPSKKHTEKDTAYPVIKDEDLLQDPGPPKAEMRVPEPESIRGAPFFTPEAYQIPGTKANHQGSSSPISANKTEGKPRDR